MFFTSPVGSRLHETLKFILQTDVSDFRIVDGLIQNDDEGLQHPVAYFSCEPLP